MERILTKITEKKPTIDILQHIRVRRGIASSTNLDCCCQIPVDIPDGIYDGPAWKTGRKVLTCFPTDEFPELPKRGRKAESIGAFHADNLTDIIKIVSPDLTLNIGGALYIAGDDDAYCCVATDGHRMYYVGDPLDPDKFPSFTLPKKALSFLQIHQTWQCWKDKDNLFFEHGNIKFSCRAIGLRFPDYRSVIEDWTKGVNIGDEHLLDFIAGFHAEIKKMGVKSQDKRVFVGTKDAMYIVSKEQEENDVVYFSNGPSAHIPVEFAVNADYIRDASDIPGKKSIYVKKTINKTIDRSICIKTETGYYVVMPFSDTEAPSLKKNKTVEIKLPEKRKKSAKLKSEKQNNNDLLDKIRQLELDLTTLVSENLRLMEQLRVIESTINKEKEK